MCRGTDFCRFCRITAASIAIKSKTVKAIICSIDVNENLEIIIPYNEEDMRNKTTD